MPDVDELTLDELCERVDLSVRTVRFYTSRGLVPPPQRRGRSGFYTPEHVARLGLVRELQAHGFTLSAIERYLARIPADASASTIALHRTLLAPWMAEMPETMTVEELSSAAGRTLGEADLETLSVLGIITPAARGTYDVAVAHLEAGVRLVDFGYPTQAAHAVKAVYAEHARAIAEQVTEIFATQVWPSYRAAGHGPEELQEAIELLKPLSIAGLVTAYGMAVNETTRDRIAQRTR
ncbi:MerR family transcriptional regulator [Nocardioides donggukensis]|uniref:MerR family transcriptional regulator n=1 Tax=Nocardioides donggukensis TaxID=2774019 RepID=A0A927K728_9ACTN|nr:MerR family transcriptional regulator [Nocardioides donggukensis]MBD8871131.1 MerR family transcriptional regulator [Nocardioides donggukensis]